MKPHDEGNAPIIMFRAHPPERLVRSLARGHIAGACCCCCCCCLHSVGSLVGGAIGSFYPRETPASRETRPLAKLRDDELDGPPENDAARSPAKSLYWLVTLGGLVLASMLAMAVNGSEDILWSLPVVLAVFLPAIQLGASLLCVLIIGSIPELRQDPRAWKRLGFITLVDASSDALLGFLIMYVFAKARG